MSSFVRIERGSLYLEAELYLRYFRGIGTAVLTGDSHTLLLLPIRHTAAGGLLMKIRNARGDRVMHVSEALIACGLSSNFSGLFPACWDPSAAALRINLTGGNNRP